MGVTIKFDGTYQKKIKNVVPSDIVLQNRALFVKGEHIPISVEELYDAFYYLAEKTSDKHGQVVINLLKSGELEFYSKTSNYSPDYFIGVVMEMGVYPSRDRVRHYKRIPDVDEYLTGDSVLY